LWISTFTLKKQAKKKIENNQRELRLSFFLCWIEVRRDEKWLREVKCGWIGICEEQKISVVKFCKFLVFLLFYSLYHTSNSARFQWYFIDLFPSSQYSVFYIRNIDNIWHVWFEVKWTINIHRKYQYRFQWVYNLQQPATLLTQKWKFCVYYNRKSISCKLKTTQDFVKSWIKFQQSLVFAYIYNFPF
jgi:hypothetical protein